MKRALILSTLLLTLAVSAEAGRTERLLARVWPAASYAPVESIGNGVGVIFSPDLSVPGNCRFYNALGFACFASPDWLRVLSDINTWNIEHPENPVRTLVLETHGTNGHGLKLQTGKHASDNRSYIAVAALQEIVEPMGVRYVILSACNSGRLLRPEIYRRLNRDPGDPLFLPANLGIVDASEAFNPDRSKVEVITPGDSHIETTLVGSVSEFAPATRKALTAAAKRHKVKLPQKFAISEMLIAMMLRDSALSLNTGGFVEEKSDIQTTPQQSEEIFAAFVAHIDFAAARSGAGATSVAVR